MFFRALGKSFCSPFNNKAGELVAVNFGKHGIYLGKATIGDPAFLAIQ